MNILPATNNRKRKLRIGLLLFSLLFSLLPFDALVRVIKDSNVVDVSYVGKRAETALTGLETKNAEAALPQFTPTSGWVATGTAVANSATNVGSYRGAVASDNVFWSLNSTAVGLNFGVNVGNFALNNANKIIVTTETANVTTARQYYIQVCDWTSSIGVNNAADANCTGGGWRTINNPKGTAFAETADTSRTFELFNGYFSTGTASGTPIDTPLSNFATSSVGLRLRFYSTSTAVVQFNLDRVQVESAIDPVYYPAGTNNIAPFNGAHTGVYADTFANQNGTVRHRVTNTAGNALNFYYSFKDVRTYEGANTLFVNYLGGYVSATTLTYNLGIYNFQTTTWEPLSPNAITASGANADQTNYFAKNSNTISDYISGGEVRIRIYSAVTGTQTLSTNTIYVTLGSTNTDVALSEVSFGQNVATTSATSTATILATTTASNIDSWKQLTCLNNTAPCATTPYASDWAGTWNTNYSAAANVSVPITPPANAQVTGIRYAARFRSNVTTNTVQLGLRDFSGLTGTTGGWIGVGSTNALTTFTFTEGIYQTNPDDYIDTTNNIANMRLRTSASTVTSAVTRDWDFAFLSIRWVEKTNDTVTIMPQFTPTSGWVATGTAVANSATNVGSYRGAVASDNVFWSLNSTAVGLNFGVNVGNFALNNANKIIVTTETANVTTARQYYIQVCDWTSSIGVNNAADANCTGGGWRTINNPKGTAFAETADTSRTFELFNGYFSTGTASGTPIDTPLSNFATSSVGLRLRFYSTSTAVVQFNLDRVQVESAIDPVYYPAGTNNIAPFNGAHTGVYADTFANQNGTVRHRVTNTAGNALNFYYSFKDVRTYEGANTLFVNYLGGYVSATTLTYNLGIYNFQTTTWEPLSPNAITASGANADQTNYFAKNSNTISDYISGGEVRIRIYSAVTGTQTLSTNTIYVTLGSTNTDVALSEVSFGQNVATTSATSTATILATTTASNIDSWKQLTCLNNTAPCATTPYASDWAGTWNTNYSAAANVSVPITPPANAQVTGIRYAARFRSNVTTNTVQLGLRDFSGLTGTTGGWIGVGSTNALTTFTFTEGIYQTNPDDYIDTTNNIANMRLRTSASTVTSAVTRDWDFAFLSIRWVENGGGAAAPSISGYTNSTESALNYSASCTDCGARIGPGATYLQTIVITGTGFGADPGAGNRDSATNRIEIVGPTSTTLIADGNVTAWSDTSITITTDTSVTGNADADWGENFGGSSALRITAGGQASNALNFYIFPQVTTLTAPTAVADAAREYAPGDSDGVITLNGTRFGSSSVGGWVRVLGCDASTCSSPSGSATTTAWSNTSITVQIPTIIADNAYTGSVVMQQGEGGVGLQHIYTASGFRILPRVSGFNPSSGAVGDAVTANGNHLCQNGGSCPAAFGASDKIVFTSGVDATVFTSWSDTAIQTAVPAGAATGMATTTSNGYASNAMSFTVVTSTPSDPSGLGQFKDSGLTENIGVGGIASATPVYLVMSMQAAVSGGTLYPQIEYKAVGSAFVCGAGACGSATEGTGVAGPGPVDCGQTGNNCAIALSLADNNYHWQARVRHRKNGVDYYSAWVSFGGNAESANDFVIHVTAPVISAVASSTTANSATVTWTTDELATSRVQYNLTGSFVSDCATNNDCTALDASLVTNHSVDVSGLASTTPYYFRVRSIDSAGNESISSNYILTTGGAAQVAVSGDLISAVFDTASSSDGPAYNSIMWQGVLAGAGQNEGKVRFQLAASDCSNGATNYPTCSVGSWSYIGGTTCAAGDWYDPGGPDIPAEIGCFASFNNKRYYRYKLQICSGDCAARGTSSPRVDEVVVNYSP